MESATKVNICAARARRAEPGLAQQTDCLNYSSRNVEYKSYLHFILSSFPYQLMLSLVCGLVQLRSPNPSAQTIFLTYCL